MPQTPLKLDVNRPLVDEEGLPDQIMRAWVVRVTNTMVIVGTGTPEGVVLAAQYSLYVDEAVPTVPVQYRKMLPEIAGDRTQGWVVV